MSILKWLNEDSQNTLPNSTIHMTRENMMKEIEHSLLEVAKSILFKNPIKIPVSSRTLTQKKQQNILVDRPTRSVRLSGKRSTKALALAYRVVVTKRDMFYRDVELFTTQSVVDKLVDNVSSHYNVPRSSLNVSASSKGLIFGPVLLQLKNGKVVDCMTSMGFLDSHDEQGLLIPPTNQVLRIYSKAKFMLIIEKEATFRHLVSVGYCQTSLESCVLVTGKGYPDLSTRHFVKRFSKEYTHLPIFALMDNDPHGLDIYATYKWGARAFAFDVINLAVKSIKLIGLICQDRIEFKIPQIHHIPLTQRDKSKCLSMVKICSIHETPGSSQMRNRGWEDSDYQVTTQDHRIYVNEIFELLRTNQKCELQSLYSAGPYGLCQFLNKKLLKYI